MKKGFVIYNDSLSVLNKLTDEQAGKLFKAIASYNKDGSLPEDSLISIVFEPFLNQFTRDAEKYTAVCKQNSEAVKSRWKNKTSPPVIDNLPPSLKEPTPPLVKTTPPIKKEPLKKKKNMSIGDFLISEYKKEGEPEDANQEHTIPNSIVVEWEKRNGVNDKALWAKYRNFYQYWTGKGKTIPPDPYKIDWVKTWINWIEKE